MSRIDDAKKTIALVRQKSDRAIVFYSGGKDSIMLLHMVAPVFKKVHLVYMYFVKGIPHIDRYLADAVKRYPNVEVLQLPHFSLAAIRKEGMYCKADPNQRLYKLSDIDEMARLQTKCFVSFYGMKKSDGMNRRLMLNTYPDHICETSNKAYPLADFTNKEVLAYIKMHRLPMPVNYQMGQSNALNFNKAAFTWMQKHDKEGLKMILAKYPLSEQILHDEQD